MKTTSKPRKASEPRRKTAPAVIEITTPPGVELHDVIRDLHLAHERTAYDGLNAMVRGGVGGMDPFGMGGMGDFMRGMVAYTVVKAAEQVLRIEDGERRCPANAEIIRKDVDLVRKQYTRTLTEARKTLGADFDRLYETSVKEHNESARLCLDDSKGMAFYFVIPKFNDDGTHEPLGPRDFPWGQT